MNLIQPGTFDDQLTEVLRNGARTLLTQAVEAEVSEFLAKHADLKTPDGHRRIVRHGRLPEARGHDWYRSGRRARGLPDPPIVSRSRIRQRTFRQH